MTQSVSPNSPRTVQCYHCRQGFDVPSAAMSISCPWCYKRVTLDDLIVKDTCWTSKVQTCGRLIVERRGTLVASYIEARSGMTILGICEGKLVSGGAVTLGPKALVRGDLEAPSIDIADGATIEGGFFKIVSAKPRSGVKAAGFVRTPKPSAPGVGGRGGTILPASQMPMPKNADGAIRAVVKLPDWIKRSLKAT